MYTEEQLEGMLTNPERIYLKRIWSEFKRHNDLLEQLLTSVIKQEDDNPSDDHKQATDGRRTRQKKEAV